MRYDHKEGKDMANILLFAALVTILLLSVLIATNTWSI